MQLVEESSWDDWSFTLLGEKSSGEVLSEDVPLASDSCGRKDTFSIDVPLSFKALLAASTAAAPMTPINFKKSRRPVLAGMAAGCKGLLFIAGEVNGLKIVRLVVTTIHRQCRPIFTNSSASVMRDTHICRFFQLA